MEEIIVDWKNPRNKDPHGFNEECERRGMWPPGENIKMPAAFWWKHMKELNKF